jgi:hypothetical protein
MVGTLVTIGKLLKENVLKSVTGGEFSSPPPEFWRRSSSSRHLLSGDELHAVCSLAGDINRAQRHERPARLIACSAY